MNELVIEALCRLNHHARAYGCGREAIYAYKTLAVLRLAHEGQIRHRGVQWHGKCGVCGGTGQYYDYGRCRRCEGSGRVTLYFIETTLPNDHIWHHPVPSRSGDHFEIARVGGLLLHDEARNETYYCPDQQHWSVVAGWRPNLPATKLEPEAACEALNIVEEWLIAERPINGSHGWRLELARRKMTEYPMHIGCTTEGCHICGDERYVALSHYRKHLRWSIPVCKMHHDERGHPRDWPTAIPAEMITPAIRVWLQRRGWDGVEPLDAWSKRHPEIVNEQDY